MSEGSEIETGAHQGCPLSPILFNIYLEDLVKNCFQNMEGVIVGGRRINCIRFADDMALLAEEDMILRDMLLELNDSCEQYGMKINANKTKSMVIGRKIKKVNLQILNEAVEEVDSFKCLGCTISSNMSCCREVKRRIAMAKEAFNRKRTLRRKESVLLEGGKVVFSWLTGSSNLSSIFLWKGQDGGRILNPLSKTRTAALLYKYSTPHRELDLGYCMDDDDDDDDI
ncbi:hypothetical protein ANN_04395 [Periplaneta americana]|uniref:Reverse transcriptase domain-containing protein n=1 Tax=Periplaneta americana TaxID=6978 RepID=A0ABQ8TAG6_PERAM|nr:hypothetical protein ANN_04395 [Periplaneta americana]